MNEGKTIWKSKTFWVNVITGLLELAQSLSGLNLIPAGYLTIGVNILNIFLRRITSEPVTFTKQN